MNDFHTRVSHQRIEADDLLLVHGLLDDHPGLLADAPGFLKALPHPWSDQPERVHSVLMRLHALARLFAQGELPGWSDTPAPDGTVDVSAEVLAVAAHCELRFVDGHPEFDRDQFLARLLAEARAGGHA